MLFDKQPEPGSERRRGFCDHAWGLVSVVVREWATLRHRRQKLLGNLGEFRPE